MEKVKLTLLTGILLLLAAPVLVFAAPAPATPTGLTVTPLSACAFNVSWTQPAPAGTSYNAERGGVVVPNILNSNTTGPQSFIDRHSEYWSTPIDPNNTYSYRVQTYNAGEGTYSSWAGPVSATASALPAKPGAPTDLALEARDGGNVRLTWLTSAPVSSYGGFEIWRAVSTDGSNYGSFSKLARIPSSQTSGGKFFYEDYNPGRDQSYRYKVYTQETGGQGCDFNRTEHVVLSDPSAETVLPKRPSGLGGNFVSTPVRKIVLGWTDESGDETGFEVWRSAGNNRFDNPLKINLGAGATNYDDISIIGTGVETYYYKIRSCAGANCSFFSDVISVSTGVPTPTDLRAGIITINNPRTANPTGNVFIRWGGVVLENTTFLIERANSSRNFVEIAQMSAATAGAQNRTHYDNNRPLNEVYYYKVRVKDSGGNLSAYSNEASVNLKILYVVKGVAWSGVRFLPPVISGGAPSGNLPSGTRSVTLRLTTSESAICRYSTTPGTAFDSMADAFASTGGTSHSQLLAVADGISYNYFVRCLSGAANTVDYPISFVVGSAPVITLNSPTAQLPADTTETTLSVTTNVAATCKYGTVPDTIYENIANTFTTTGGTTHEQTISGLRNGDIVHYYIRCNAGGNINANDFLAPDGVVVSVAVPDVPLAPSDLATTAVSTSTVDIAWTDNSPPDETRFEVYRYKTVIPGETEQDQVYDYLNQVGANVTAYSDQSVEPDSTYWYKVKACNSSGCSPISGGKAEATTPPSGTSGGGDCTLTGCDSGFTCDESLTPPACVETTQPPP